MNYSQYITSITGRVVTQCPTIWVWDDVLNRYELAADIEPVIEDILDGMLEQGTFYDFIDSIGELPDSVATMEFEASTARGINQEMAFWVIFAELEKLRPKPAPRVVH